MEIKPKVDTTTRKWLMTTGSFRHPAKMNIAMLLWIMQKYTKPGDVILDPMAGCGTTMLACWMGRNVVLVELEQKFIDMCNANWEKLRQMPPALGFEMGDTSLICGDARDLDMLLPNLPVLNEIDGDSKVAILYLLVGQMDNGKSLVLEVFIPLELARLIPMPIDTISLNDQLLFGNEEVHDISSDPNLCLKCEGLLSQLCSDNSFDISFVMNEPALNRAESSASFDKRLTRIKGLATSGALEIATPAVGNAPALGRTEHTLPVRGLGIPGKKWLATYLANSRDSISPIISPAFPATETGTILQATWASLKFLSTILANSGWFDNPSLSNEATISGAKSSSSTPQVSLRNEELLTANFTNSYSPATAHNLIIQADAKNVNGADCAIFSPPYADQPQPSRTNHGILNHKPDCECNFCRKNRGNKGMIQGYRQADVAIFSPPYAETKSAQDVEFQKRLTKDKTSSLFGRNPDGSFFAQKGTENPDNISNLPYGSIDAAIFSPPYSEIGIGDWSTPRYEFQAWVKEQLETKGYIKWRGKRYTEQEWRDMNYGRLDGRVTKGVHKQPTDGYSPDPSNIGNLPHGDIDAIISSPPYEEAMGKKHHSPRADKLAKEKRNPTTYTEVDAIISSPPYEGSVSSQKSGIDWSKGTRGEAEGWKPRDKSKEPAFNHSPIGGAPWAYSEADENLGNLKGDTYLSAMQQVYAQCYKVLKPNGLMILVTKNFIRNKQIVPLDEHTISLCESVGFSLLERHHRKLTSQSFWRVIYQKKYPDAPVIDREDILVFRKEDLGV